MEVGLTCPVLEHEQVFPLRRLTLSHDRYQASGSGGHRSFSAQEAVLCKVDCGGQDHVQSSQQPNTGEWQPDSTVVVTPPAATLTTAHAGLRSWPGLADRLQ